METVNSWFDSLAVGEILCLKKSHFFTVFS